MRARIRQRWCCTALYWAAWTVSLGPWIGTSLYLWVVSGFDASLFIAGLALFPLFVLPAFSVWGSRPLGGVIMIGWGAFNVYRLCSSPIDWHELDFIASAAGIPFWATFIAGGILHIMDWWVGDGSGRRDARVTREADRFAAQ